MSELAEHLIEEFADKGYAHAYMEEHGNMLLAAQIKELREMRGLTQSQLAELAGMKQERISALENVEYDAWTVKTLRKLAAAFDTGLQVSFVPFSQAIMGVVNITHDRLKVVSRTEDIDNFRLHKIIQSGGKWTAIDRNHLASVTPLAPHQPVAPQKGWQRLDIGMAHAVRG